MSASPLPSIVLYERAGCHLCEGARAHLEQLLASWAEAGRNVPALVGRDIDSDPAWHDAFFETIPVVEVGEQRLPLATSPARVRRFLEEALGDVDRPSAGATGGEAGRAGPSPTGAGDGTGGLSR